MEEEKATLLGPSLGQKFAIVGAGEIFAHSMDHEARKVGLCNEILAEISSMLLFR